MATPLNIHCGLPHLGSAVEEALSTVPDLGSGSWHLVLDGPIGWAPMELDRLDPTRSLVVTDNPCPDYRIDLIERGVAAVLSQAGPDEILAVLDALETHSYRIEAPASVLTPAERLTLRLIAEGFDSKAIAARRGVSDGTLRNTVHTIYMKLGLRSSVHLAHYYFGHWEVLASRLGWMPGLLVA